MSTGELCRKQERWEIAKAVAAFVVGCAAFMGAVLAVSAWWRPAPQNITVHLDFPLPPGTSFTVPRQ